VGGNLALAVPGAEQTYHESKRQGVDKADNPLDGRLKLGGRKWHALRETAKSQPL